MHIKSPDAHHIARCCGTALSERKRSYWVLVDGEATDASEVHRSDDKYATALTRCMSDFVVTARLQRPRDRWARNCCAVVAELPRPNPVPVAGTHFAALLSAFGPAVPSSGESGMNQGMAERFAAALQQTEQTKDVQPVAQLFSDDAILSSPEREIEQRGSEAIRDFWQHYLASFDTIRSEFHVLREADGLCVLEWQSTGTWKNGKTTTYRGASLLEVKDDQVHRFATYYDTAALGRTETSQA